jgi:hypothetical protein
MSLVLALLAAAPVWVGRFPAEGAAPAPWQVVRLNKKVAPTTYRSATVAGTGAIEAKANKSMALLARPLRVDLARTPILCWRWLIDAPVAKADLRKKSGDDYAARIYVAFDIPDDKLGAGTRMKLSLGRRMFGGNLPDAALNYVWDNKHAVGTRAKSPYTDRAELIVAETGGARAGGWVRSGPMWPPTLPVPLAACPERRPSSRWPATRTTRQAAPAPPLPTFTSSDETRSAASDRQA